MIDQQNSSMPNGERTNTLTRRGVLATGASALGLAAAGCLSIAGDDDSESGDDGGPSTPEATESADVPEIPSIDDPPAAVYKPTHRESMRHLDPVDVGEYTVGPMLSYPHAFWTVTGADTQEVRPRNPGVHLMFTVWDSETGTVLPVDIGAEVRTLRDGEVVDTRKPWPMISQSMGFHFGDNVPLPEEGTYTVEVDLNPVTTRLTRAFEGRFDTRRTATFEFEWDTEFRRDVVDGVQYLDEDEWGEPGALDPMMGGDGSMEGDGMPFSALPPEEAYPGQTLGTFSSGDATFVFGYHEESPLGDGDGYLFVSPRTPHNRVPLADMALSVRGALPGDLTQTLDSELGHHYGIPASLAEGEEFELVVDSPPQVARHRGYETAFIEMPAITVEVTG